MKLAICSPGEIFGGVERQIIDLAGQWGSKHGLQPVVIFFHDGEPAKRVRDLGLDPVILDGYGPYDRRIVDALVGVLRKHNIDTIHVHGYKATVLCGLAKIKYPCRLVKTEHGKVEATIHQPVRYLRLQTNFAVEQWITRRWVDSIIYVTNDIARYHSKRHRMIERCVVHNGIDPLDPEALRRPSDLPSGGRNVGIVGRLSVVKGISLAVKALADSKIPSDVHLVVLGSGPEESSILETARSLGVLDRVHLLGFRSDIFSYIRHFDVVLMPSFHEGLPYSLLEAMSLSRPIAASRVGGLVEVIEDGRTGMLFPPGDIAAIANCLSLLLAGDKLGRALGDNARQEQIKNYSLAKMFAETEMVLTGATAGHQPPENFASV